MYRNQPQLSERMEVHNTHHEQDVRYSMQLCRWILQSIGIWHWIYRHLSYKEKLISVTLFILCFTCLCFVLLPTRLYALFFEEDINVQIKLFGPVGFCLTSTIKYWYLGARGTAFGECIQHVEKDWQIVHGQDLRSIMLKNALTGRKLTTLCACFLYTGAVSYHGIMPLFASWEVEENITSRPFNDPGTDLFFGREGMPPYEIVFCVHCLFIVSYAVTYSITAAACSLAAIFVTHACGQIQILIVLLNDLVNGTKNKNTTIEERLSLIVKHHVRVLRFSARVNEVLREVLLMELVTSTLFICLLEYYCITEWENSDAIAIWTYFILLISFTFNILIFCYIGELLVKQYNRIGLAVYDVNWYDLAGNKAVNLIMIIVMSNYPPKLTAGKFCDLSVYTFGVVLKTSVVYLNLLRTVTE